MALLFAPPFYRATDLSNAPIPGAFIGFYKTLTSELQPIYADAGLTISLANPLPSDGNGVFPAIWLDDALPAYKFVIYAPDQNDITVPGAVLRTGDPYAAPLNLAALITQINPLINPITQAELDASVVPSNFAYVPGHVYRYGTNTVPGTTDMTGAINAAANVCRQGGYTLQVPSYDVLLVSASLDFTGLNVQGLGSPFGGAGCIQATSAQFDIITLKQSGGFAQSTFNNLSVDGANPLKTAGLSGDTVSLKKTSPAHPYVVSFRDCKFTNAKKRGIYIERGGYTSFSHVLVLNAGLHALECFGTNVDQCTTVHDYGSSQFSGCPNGYAVKLTECTSMGFDGSIMEDTWGIQINGLDQRAITFRGVHMENFTVVNPTGFFINDNGGGLGLTVQGCFGGNLALPFFTNWQDVHLGGNTNLSESAVPFPNRIFQADGGALTTSTTGGVEVTSASQSLAPGTWLVWGTLQTITNTATTLTQAACRLTTNVADSGLANSTSSFVVGAAEATYNPGAALDQRLLAFQIFQLTATTTVYLRSRLTFSGAGNLTYRGYLNCVKFQ